MECPQIQSPNAATGYAYPSHNYCRVCLIDAQIGKVLICPTDTSNTLYPEALLNPVVCDDVPVAALLGAGLS